MKKTLIIATTFLLIISTLGCSKETKLEGGEKELVSFTDTKLNISTNDLYEKLKDKYGINFLIDMIDTKILDKEFPDSDSINDYVNIQVNSIKNYYKTETEFLEYINNYGYKNEDELKDIVSKQYSVIKYKTVVNDKEIYKIFKDNMDEYLNTLKSIKF